MPHLKNALRLFALLLPFAAGCMTMAPIEPSGDGGTHAGGMMDMAGAASNPDALPPTGRTFGQPCDNNAQCTSMLCTKDSYDRLTSPICTYKCDPAAPSNPQCPNGCNMKGYCKLGM